MSQPEKSNGGIIIAFIIFFLIAGAGVYYGMVKSPQDNKIGESDIVENTDTTTNNGGLQITTTQEGTGEAVVSGQTIQMNYTGKLDDGTVFDSNVDPKFGHVEPFEFTLGAGQVIPGWDRGIVGMKVGEKRTLVIPSTLAYGANGIPGAIPANATLTFDVELTGIKK